MADQKQNIMDLEMLRQTEMETLENPDVVKKVAVFGAGIMGRGISELIASKGMEVILIEMDERAAKEGLKALEKNIDEEIARWTMTESEKRAILSRVTVSSKPKDAIHGDLVIEAISENMEAKRSLLVLVDSIIDPNTIFITNTSALSITEIAAGTERQEKVIGMHFLNPVPKIPLVEIVRGLKTSDETFHFIKSFAETLDKTAVEVFEYPGYITTRVIVPLINEAIYILMEGVASAEDIDTAMKLGYNFSKGPLALADSIGLDELMAWMETLFRELGDQKYRPCPLLRKLVRAGHLGRKSGRGFFKYN